MRIIAFFLLILYHVGMYYVTWDWHVKSHHASDTLEPFMVLSAPWRLSLLFLVSGVASSCMLAKLRPLVFLRKRSWRLLIPLLFGMLVIVPPQSYFEVIEKLGYAGSYADFMQFYVRGYHGFCKDGCLILPTWNHLWFVAYLWAYTVVLALLVLALGPRFDRDGPARRYLTEAVFPVYILHQTLIVVLAHALKPLHRAPGLEAMLLVVFVTVASFTGFEIVRRVPLLRPLFGLGPRGPVASPAGAAVGSATPA